MNYRYFDFKYFFQIIIILISFYYTLELNFFRHWSTTWDQDLILLHNSLLLNSGIKAEYHDHPGHTQILLISLWIDFLELLNIINFSSYDEIEKMQLSEKNFSELVKYSRFVNFFSLILFAYAFYGISKIIIRKKFSSYLLTILFITSFPIIKSISYVRTELLSAALIFLSLFFLLKLVNKKKLIRKNIFLSGFTFVLSIFCKFQSIFIFILFPLLFFFIKKNKIKVSLNFFENKKFYEYSIYIYLVAIFMIWLKYVKGLNFLIFPFLILYFYLFLKYLNKRYFESNNFNRIFIHYFLIGSISAFVLLFIPKPFHTNNISMIINFFGASSMFVQGSDLYQFNLNEVFKLVSKSFNAILNYLKIIFIKYSFIELILFSSSSLFLIRNYPLNKNLKNYFKIVLFLFLIIFLFSVRPKYNYTIYFMPIIYFYFIYIFSFVANFKYTKFFILLLIFINIFNNLNFVKLNKYKSDKDIICSKQNYNNTVFFIKKMELDIFTKICKI